MHCLRLMRTETKIVLSTALFYHLCMAGNVLFFSMALSVEWDVHSGAGLKIPSKSEYSVVLCSTNNDREERKSAVCLVKS